MEKPHLTERAKELRRNETDAERLMWSWLRAKQINGIKFRRQQPIGGYIVDFVSFEKKLIIEIDGGQHNFDNNRENDRVRTEWFEAQGYRVIRFWNTDVYTNREGVLYKVVEAMEDPHPDPLPSQGEG